MKVLVAVDESKFAKAAVESIAERPWQPDTEFLVLSVVPAMVPATADWHGPYVTSILDAQGAIRELHEKVVNEHVAFLKDKMAGVAVIGKVLEGSVRDNIVEMARAWHADFIVMGSHGRTGVARFLLGSVAEAVLNSAPCSVEIIRMPVHEEKKTKHEERKKVGLIF